MNIRDTFLLPWKLSPAGMRSMSLALFVMAASGAAAVAIFSRQPDRWVCVTGIIGVAEALIWPLCLSTTILLTIDAQQLRLPGIQRQAVTGMLINVVLGTLVPAFVIGWFDGHTVAVALIVGLMIVAGWFYSLLPRLVSLVLYMAGVVLISGKSLRQMPAHADFFNGAWPALVVGMVVVAICWRRLALAPNPYRLSWHSPMVLRLNRGLSSAVAGGHGRPQAVRRPEWLRGRGDLRHCGPGHPVTSLRMALGGIYMPLTFMSWLRRFAVAVAAIGIFAAWFVVGDLKDMTFSGLRDGNAFAMLMLCGAAASVIFAIACLIGLETRWRRVNAELPLLALLPELGGDVKRDFLRAALWSPLRMLLLAAALVLALLPRIGVCLDMFGLLAVTGTAGFVIAFTLRVAGRCRSARWESRVVTILGFLLFSGTLLVGVFSLDASLPQADLDMLHGVLLVGWLAVAVMLYRLGRRGWRGLQQRPHPFMPN